MARSDENIRYFDRPGRSGFGSRMRRVNAQARLVANIVKHEEKSGAVVGALKTVASPVGTLTGIATFAGADVVAKAKGSPVLPSAIGAIAGGVGLFVGSRKTKQAAREALVMALAPHAVDLGRAVGHAAVEAKTPSEEPKP